MVNKPKKKSKEPSQKKGSEEAISQILRTAPSGAGDKTPLCARSTFSKTALQTVLQNPVYSMPYTVENQKTAFSKVGKPQPDPSILSDDLNTVLVPVSVKESYESLMGKEVKANHIARSLIRQSLDNYTKAQRKTATHTVNSTLNGLPGAMLPQIQGVARAQHQAGSGLVPTGLDAQNAQDKRPVRSPVPGTATAVPGMEGTAAANPIDMHVGRRINGSVECAWRGGWPSRRLSNLWLSIDA